MNADKGKAVLSCANSAITWAAEGDHHRTQANWDDLVYLVRSIINSNANNQDA